MFKDNFEDLFLMYDMRRRELYRERIRVKNNPYKVNPEILKRCMDLRREIVRLLHEEILVKIRTTMWIETRSQFHKEKIIRAHIIDADKFDEEMMKNEV